MVFYVLLILLFSVIPAFFLLHTETILFILFLIIFPSQKSHGLPLDLVELSGRTIYPIHAPPHSTQSSVSQSKNKKILHA